VAPGDSATAVGRSGAVASAETHASQVGIDILRRGGNAVDAAIAVGFALSVTHPSAGNIGGGGFMLLRFPDGRATSLDYRERAPAAAQRDMFLDAQGEVTRASRVGPLAAGIPGNVAGFGYAHANWGSLPWQELVAPAIALARDGWVLDAFHAADLRRAVESMEAAGYLESAALFRRADGSAYEAGDRWRQPELATTLERIARDGPQAFYAGPLAETMVREVRRLGGLWTGEDLAGYAPVERAPIRFDYRGFEILSMPPPSAGGIVLRQILAGAETLGLHALPWHSPERAHLYVEILRRAYVDRNHWIGDPDFVAVPLAQLLDLDYLARRVADIDPERATPSSEIGAGSVPFESEETTHFSVVDAAGLAVANTYTLNGSFGAKLVIPGTGVILNNEMDDFTAKVGEPNMFGLVQGERNTIAPGKRMLSSMTPTILVRDGELRAILGSPGGPTITTTVAQLVLQLVDYGRSISDAVREPRIHHQWLPDIVLLEEAIETSLVEALEARGHRVVRRPRFGHANCIEVDPVTGGFRAIADEARDGGKALAF
jgi:gamma-glutamyltranspeptidase/glutathione hydrolase